MDITDTLHSGSPELLKKAEKEIMHEAKDEEKGVKNASKDLKHGEKEEHKAHKAAEKAQSTLAKAEKKEEETQKEIYKAEHKHDVAVTDLNKAQNDLKFTTQKDEKLKESVRVKVARLEEATKANDEHAQARNAKIDALRAPSVAEDAGKVIPETDRVPAAEGTQAVN